MTDNYDQLALSWVRKEINNTLDQARQGLENFAEDINDQTQIQFCINCLHQVQGTLQMLEFVGAAMLAQEMESLAEKMATNQAIAVESSFEVLMRALLQMPGYLERVEEGQKDIPLILLPLINQLRAASGTKAITERELFSAGNFDVAPPKAIEKVSEKDKTTAFQDNAKKLRVHFQKGLTGLIRGQDVKECLSRIHKVLLRLEGLTEGHSVSRLWWIADGFIFSIAEGGLYKKSEIHKLLSQIDKQIKRLADIGSEALGDEIPKTLLSELLYFVARSKSTNERVVELKKEFNLESVLADSQEIKARQAKLARPDSSAVINVVGAINEELNIVKDQLDLFVRAKAKDPSQLQTLAESLTRIADTLTLLELAIPRDVIRQQIRSIQRLVDLNQMPDDAIVMDIAGALLFVEANLKNVNLEVASEAVSEEASSERSQMQAKETQVDEATRALIKVARKSMQLAKDRMINYIASGFEQEALAEVPALLDEVLGAVRIVQFDHVASMLHTAREFIERKIIQLTQQPREEYLDALADVITSVEYYLEASEDGGHRRVESILKGAQNSIDALNRSLEEVEPVVEQVTVTKEEIVQGVDAESEEIKTSVKPVETAKVIPMVIPAANKVVDETLIDEEVLEIFLEEAEEEIQTIEQMLPRWINNIQDEDALSTLRRSFHTLKGSGRLVGASVIGEVSWSIENMLNKVIEDSIPAETPVTGLLNEAFTMLPSLVEAFAKQIPVAADYHQLIAKAEHVSSGKPLSSFAYAAPSMEIEAATSEVVFDEIVIAETAKEEAIDPILLEIFTTEAEGHLQSIRNYLQTAPTEGTIAVSDELIRALHTLKGSAHMAGVDLIADLTGPWEKHARIVKGSNQRFDQSVMVLLKETHAFLVDTLSGLKTGLSLDSEKLSVLQDKIALLDVSGGVAGGLSVKQRDQHFVSIFLTEGLDILHEVSKLNESLKTDLNNQSLKQAIKREMQAFHHGSQLLAIDELETLAQASDNLAVFALDHEAQDQSFNELLDESIDCLTTMLNRLASEQDIEPPSSVVAKISQWIESVGQTSIPEDMDVELVELFVEEGEELIESARDLLARWKDNLHSKEINSELRRIYHTLKGSSRMAGAMGIGELGYAAEDMFNTVIDFGRVPSSQDYEIVVKTTDKLESMIAELKTLRWPGAATQEVRVIRQFLSPESEEEVEDIVVSAPIETAEVIEAEIFAEEVILEEEPIEEEPIEEAAFDTFEIVEETSSVDEMLIEADEEIPMVSETIDEDEIVLELEEDNEWSADSIIEAVPQAEDEETDFGEITLIEEIAEDSFEVSELQESAETESAEIESAETELTELEEEEAETDFAVTESIEEATEEFGEIELAAPEFEETEIEAPETIVSEETEEFAEAEITETTLTSTEFESVDEEVESFEAESLIEETTVEETAETESTSKESTTEVVTEDRISPSAPIVFAGEVHKVELDEDGEEVLEIYLEEAEELLVALDEALHDWSSSLENKKAIDLLQRTLHTFKGGARLSDLVVLGDLTHEMETYFEKINRGDLKARQEDVGFMLQGYDVIEKLVNEVRDHRQMTIPTQYMNALEKLIKGESPAAIEADIADLVTQVEPDKVAAEEAEQEAKKTAEVFSFEAKKQQQEETRQRAPQGADVVRVTSDQLENLVNLAGETSIFRSRLEQQMSVLRYNLEEMNATVDRLREQLRNLDIETDAQISYRREVSGGMEYEDFDPLEMDRYTRQQELTRGLSESAVDLVSLKETLDLLTADSETLLLQQGRVNTEMQESLMRTRMIPFESLVPRLRRMVRQISTELGKTIELSISADGEMDRTVLERMVAPLEHMLRNAMDHGIESPEERRANQKPETGSVKISMFREGNEVYIKLQDDGRGLNLKAIRKKAIEKGLINESSELSDHELQQLILEAGFSTAEQITQISGRGVGMDVVSSEIKQLGGVIEINSFQGVGTTFTVRLPFTMSVNHALMVQLGDEVYAIPLANIEGIVRVSPFELEEYYANPESAFDYAGIDYSMYYLGQLLDHNSSANLQGVTQPLPVLLLHGADHPTALQVDDLLGSREIVVKSIGSQLSSISGLSGATILGDGRVVLILDMPALIRRIDATLLEADRDVVEVVEAGVPVIMVVDDSITVRKVTTRLLERHDFKVITAKDGVDALTVLGEQKPDVMLLDIEMPRMDGFELATIIRHDEALKDLPIIMITSRTGEKHRERAEQIGVNQYMGKPYNEVDLLESISALLPNKS